ncbi:hypothetical protein BC829DRAFT_38152 [Chytridium lagenaria]|nr:hypothetical protein BC829DRAFT_38152 [Chytridium lagenaria]
MKDKHASLSKSFHTLHGESVVSLAKLGLSIEQRISNTLLANNCNLLALICQAPIAGDTAAVISKGVISLLRRQNGNATEKFLQRLLLAKIKQYQKKGRDLSDIIRDNSMAAMLLNAFARNEGLAYLNQSLGPPLQTVMGYVDQCEIDPQRLNAESDTDIHANEERLKQSCTTLLDHVSEKREGMPPSIRRICSFIKSNIEIALQAQETDRLSDHGRGLLNKTLNSFDDKTSSRNSSIRRSRSPSSPWQADDNRQRARGKSVSSSLNSPKSTSIRELSLSKWQQHLLYQHVSALKRKSKSLKYTSGPI